MQNFSYQQLVLYAGVILQQTKQVEHQLWQYSISSTKVVSVVALLDFELCQVLIRISSQGRLFLAHSGLTRWATAFASGLRKICGFHV